MDFADPDKEENKPDEEENSYNAREDEDRPANPTRYLKKKLTYKRKVHSTETAPDESNYQPMMIPEKEKQMKGVIENKKDIKKTITYNVYI